MGLGEYEEGRAMRGSLGGGCDGDVSGAGGAGILLNDRI